MTVQDRGVSLTCRAIYLALRALAAPSFELRLIHETSRAPYPGRRIWPAPLIIRAASFLRLRNKEGYNVYFRPYAGHLNAGCILVDLDRAPSKPLEQMRSDGLAPCLVVQTSPGHLQAWIRITADQLDPAAATQIARYIARSYGADPASADWRHLGRLPGFTNQKLKHRTHHGLPPWVLVRHAAPSLAPAAQSLILKAHTATLPTTLTCNQATILPQASPPIQNTRYDDLVRALRILDRFPSPDWSIVDKWVAKELLRRRVPAQQVIDVIRSGSPSFPRRHYRPDDYLRRTLMRAAQELRLDPFPARTGTTTRAPQSLATQPAQQTPPEAQRPPVWSTDRDPSPLIPSREPCGVTAPHPT